MKNGLEKKEIVKKVRFDLLKADQK